MAIRLDSTPEEVLQEMERIRVMYELKTTLRYETRRNGSHSESVAEHIFGMFVLADYFLPLEEPNGTLDRTRIHELILFHEIGEIETGDFVSHKKNDKMLEEERAAAVRVAKRLPDGMSEKAIERFRETDEVNSPEAELAEAIDKLEPIFEMLPKERWPYYRQQNMNREISVIKKMRTTRKFPYMRLFLDVWTEFMVAHNVFAED